MPTIDPLEKDMGVRTDDEIADYFKRQSKPYKKGDEVTLTKGTMVFSRFHGAEIPLKEDITVTVSYIYHDGIELTTKDNQTLVLYTDR